MRGVAAWPERTAPGFVELAECPPPADGEVLCRTIELGICGTDREVLASARPHTPEGEAFLVLGHECLARVEEVGAGVGDVAVGDLVVPVVRRPLPGGRRRVDLLAWGGYTERGIVCEHGFSLPYWLDREACLFAVEPQLAPFAVLTEPMAVAEKGVNEAITLQRARLGEDVWRDPPPRVLVTGLGPIAFAAQMAVDCRGWPATVAGRDRPDSTRAGLVAQLGGTYRMLSELTTPSDVETGGFDLIMECTGSDSVMIHTAAHLASCGVMVWLGSSRRPRPVEHDVSRLMREAVVRNHLHLGCVNAAPRDFRHALEHLRDLSKRRRAAVGRTITDRVAPGDSLWHFQHRRPQGVKVVVVYE